MLHRQQQFRAASVNAGLILEVRQHLAGFNGSRWLMYVKAGERRHTFGTVRRDSIPRACWLFFCWIAFHTRSGVNGSVLIRAPVARYSAFARHGAIGFTAPSPPPFAP